VGQGEGISEADVSQAPSERPEAFASDPAGDAPEATPPALEPGGAVAASTVAPPADCAEAAEPHRQPSQAQRAASLPGPTLRDAARAVLAAWDANDGVRLAAALDGLRAALPTRREPRQAGTPRTPRQGARQAAVLALLRRPEGASGPDIIAATGWAPHTVRGFLAGLKQRAIAALVHERVRQVGPGREGAKGSYTVYRIAAGPAG
jgi:hypothetical protein